MHAITWSKWSQGRGGSKVRRGDKELKVRKSIVSGTCIFNFTFIIPQGEQVGAKVA